MQATLIIVFALLGTSIGSFLNVVIYRLPRRKPFWRFGQRSYCPNCKTTLEPKDLVPILSFVILRGKCRHCKKHISWQYIIVESVTALAFAVCAGVFGLSLELLYALVLISFAIPLCVIDARHKVIPDALSIPFIVV
ncbi:MAG: prepilin peptidase, partial [Patescibacteria group bacterium]